MTIAVDWDAKQLIKDIHSMHLTGLQIIGHTGIFFLISQPKHMLWVLKRTVSMKRLFWAPKTHD